MALLLHSLNHEGVQGDLQSYNFLKLVGVKWKRKTKLKQIKNNPQTVATGIVRFAFTTTITFSTMLGNVRILLLSSYVGRSLVKSLWNFFFFHFWESVENYWQHNIMLETYFFTQIWRKIYLDQFVSEMPGDLNDFVSMAIY